MDVEPNPGDITSNSEERLRRNQNCIIPPAGGYTNFQNAEPIVYSSQHLLSLKSCASVLPRDVKNCLSDMRIARRKCGVRAGRQSKEGHYNLCQIPSRITSRSTENDNKKPTHWIVDRPNERGHIPENCTQVFPVTQSKTLIPSLLLSNVCHISNKVDELQGVAEINNASIAIVTESWLTSETPSSSISIGENEDKEVLWLKLFPPRLPRPFSFILVACIHFPPGKTAEEEKNMIEYLTNCIDAVLKDNPSVGVLLAGDFNKLCNRNLCRRFNLQSLVHAPTRGINFLDQILTNMYSLFEHTLHLPPLRKSDHQCLLIEPRCQQLKLKPISRE